MKVHILDDWFDTLRTLPSFARLKGHDVTVWNDHVEDPDVLGERLRDAEALVVAHPDEMIEGEDEPGAPSKADVQAQIDAAPQTFQAMSNTLAEETERLTAAIAARDAEAMWESALRLDPTCVACHDRFWRSGRPIPD